MRLCRYNVIKSDSFNGMAKHQPMQQIQLLIVLVDA